MPREVTVGCAVVGVEADPQMVDQREVAAVVGRVGFGHPIILAPDLTTVDAGLRRCDRGESNSHALSGTGS